LVTDISTIDANIGVLVTDIQTLDANVGQITLDLDTINANITAANAAIVDLETAGYITAATANVVSVNGQTGVVEITIPSSYTDANVTTYLPTYTGSLSPTLLTVSGDASVTGVLNISTITEKFVSNSVPGTVTDIDWAGAGIHYLTNLTANITANLQNVAIASGTVSSVTIWISQGGTAYVPTALNINNAPQTINWAGSTVAPGGTANKQDLVSFTIMNTAGTYNVLAQLSSYG
jgi:hypothetical protein